MTNEEPGSGSFAIRHSNFVIGLLVLLPMAVLFGPVLFTDRSFAMRDAAHFYHPLFAWTAQEWGAGRVPLWNPDENCGMPVVADASSSVFYPGKLVFALPVDFTLRYKLYVIGHVLLAAVGSYWLARHWQTSHAAAGAAALCYACGGNVVFQYCNVVFLVGAAWLPWAALAADRMLCGQSWRAAVALGGVLALMILGGEPQAAYHALLMTGLYAVVLARAAKPAEPNAVTGSCQKIKSSPFARRILLAGLAALAGSLFSAIQILPSSEASQESERAAYRRPRTIYEIKDYVADVRAGRLPNVAAPGQEIGRGILGRPDPGTHHERAYWFSVGPWRFAEFIWPNVSGRMFPTNRRWLSTLPAEGQIWTPTLYMGLLPVLLAAAQLRLWRGDERKRWLSWLALLSALGSLGWYSLGWIAQEFCVNVLKMDAEKLAFGPQVGGVYWLMTTVLPAYVSFRYPAKLLVVTSLAVSQLAAFGWDRLFAEQRSRFAAALKLLGGASAALLVAAWGTTTWLSSVLAPGAAETPLKEQIASFLRQHADGAFGPFDWRGSSTDVQLALLQTAVLCAVLLWLLSKAWNERQQAAKWQLATLLVLALDVAAANYWLAPSAPASVWRDPPAAAKAIEAAAHPRVFRADFGGWRPRAFRQQSSRERMGELAQWERDSLFPKYPLPHGIGLVESYGSLKSAHFESLLVVARSYGPPQPGEGSRPLPAGSALRLLGTEYLMLPDKYLPGTKDRLFAEKLGEVNQYAQDGILWKVKSTFPRARIVHEVETLAPLTGRLDLESLDARATEVLYPFNPHTKQRAARDLRMTTVVETDAPIDLTLPPSGNAKHLPEMESCQIVLSEPARVEIEVALRQPGLVVLSDTYAPGWVALLRSTEDAAAVQQEVPIYRTNRVLRGVVVPEGRHQLTFVYRPVSFYRGAAVSLLAWTALGLAISVGLIRSQLPRRDLSTKRGPG